MIKWSEEGFTENVVRLRMLMRALELRWED